MYLILRTTKVWWILVLYFTVTITIIGNKCVNGLSSTNDAGRGARKLFGGYRITPKFCRASKSLPKSDPRALGPTMCMFSHECSQRHGEVVGACMDGFLFGTCCQLPLTVDTPLFDTDNQYNVNDSPAAQSYETYVNNNYGQNNFGGGFNEILLEEGPLYGLSSSTQSYHDAFVLDANHNHHYVDSDSVIVSSASPEYSTQTSYFASSSTPYATTTTTTTTPSTTTTKKFPQNFYNDVDEELPTLLHMPNNDDTEFTYSGITHPEADSVLIENSDDLFDKRKTTGFPVSSSTEIPSTRNTYPVRPGFRPKPTTSSISSTSTSDLLLTNNGNKYVLVQTISNDKPIITSSSIKPTYSTSTTLSTSSMSDNDIESIESIILMLNDTKSGTHYNTYVNNGGGGSGSSTESPQQLYSDSIVIESSPYYIPTSSINYDNKYDDGIHLTSKLPILSTPKPPSTSYVFSPSPTKRPNVQSTIASSFGSHNPHVDGNLISSSSTTKPYPNIVYKNLTTDFDDYLTTFHTSSTSRPTVQDVLITQTTHKKPTSTKSPPTKIQQNKLTTSYVTASTTRPKTKPKTPTIPTSTSKLPSTSYVTGPTTPKPKPKPTKPNKKTTIKTSISANHTTPSTLILSDSYEKPTPTVHITPKPTVNLITSSSWTQKPNINKFTNQQQQTTKIPPSTSYVYSPVVTHRPNYPSSTPIYDPATIEFDDALTHYGPVPIYGGSTLNYDSINDVHKPPYDFDDPGYFGPVSSTHKPSSNYNPLNDDDAATFSSSQIYPGYFGAAVSYGQHNKQPPIHQQQQQPPFDVSTLTEEYYTSPNDINNFPPVRNPNLNMSATFNNQHNGIIIEDYDISTPSFVDDQALNDKMSLLVSKIVQSLSGNFNELSSVVSNATDKPQSNSKPTTVKPRPSTVSSTGTITKRPPTRKPQTKPATAVTKPVQTLVTRPRPKPKPTAAIAADTLVGGSTTKRPINKISTTKKTVTTIRPAADATTKRPTKKPPSKKPISTPGNTTKKPISKVTTKRPKPTQTTSTTSAQEDSTEYDEYDDSENTVNNDETDENVGEESEATEDLPQDGKMHCGTRPLVKSGRIVGGKASKYGAFPWQVMLRESTWLGLFTKNKCGGVLISKDYVMSAAHCQPGFLASLLAVFGEFDISGDFEKKHSVTKNVKRVVVHREYDAATFENDLALLELQSPIHFDTHIIPICMPSDSIDVTGRLATVTGWGRLKYGGGVPSILQEVQVPIIENSVCQEMFHTAGHNKKILQSFLCAGYANGQKDSCEGDSGGPLVLQRPDGRWELAGTVSHGIKCAAPYLPGVYMRTTYYKPWIESVTGLHFKQ